MTAWTQTQTQSLYVFDVTLCVRRTRDQALDVSCSSCIDKGMLSHHSEYLNVLICHRLWLYRQVPRRATFLPQLSSPQRAWGKLGKHWKHRRSSRRNRYVFLKPLWNTDCRLKPVKDVCWSICRFNNLSRQKWMYIVPWLLGWNIQQEASIVQYVNTLI